MGPAEAEVTDGGGPSDDPKAVRSLRRRELRQRNLAAWEGENVFEVSKSLDTSLKKNTAFIKRCRVALADESLKILLNEVSSLSLEKYLTEILSALVEGFTKCKSSADIFAGVEIASALHQRFSTKFTPRLLSYFLQGISNPPRGTLKALATDARLREDQARNNRHKIVLRVLIELWVVGVFRGVNDVHSNGEEVPKYALQKMDNGFVAPPPLSALEEVAMYDLEYFTATQLMIVLLKNYGGLLAGVKEKPYEAGFTSDDIKARFRKLFEEYNKMLQNALASMAHELLQMEKRNERSFIRIGKVMEDKQEAIEDLLTRFREMEAACKILSDLLGMPMPEYKTSIGNAESEVHISIGVSANDDYDAGIWDDEEQRKFYEDILDITFHTGKASESADAETGSELHSRPDNLENTTRDGDDDNVDEVMKELDFLMLKSGTAESETNVNSLGANGMGNTSAEGDDDIVLESEIDETASQGDEVDENAVASAGARVADILTSLAAQSSRAHVDAMALEFVRFNNKATIARTIKFFKSEISIHDHYLLPFYARFLATIDPVFPEITKGVLEYLDSYFKWLHKRRKAANLESRRMFNIRFISELTKFNLVPKIMILNKLLLMIEHLDSFNIGNIFALFEGCGRFLMRKPDTHPVLVKLLKLLEQKKNAKYFSPEEKTMLDGAVSFLNPPKAVVNVKERPVIELYIRQLIYKDLDRDTADAVLLQLRRMDWDDPDAYRVLLKVFSKIHKVKYSNIPYMAGFLKFLEPYYPSFAVHVVDRLMENIRRGVEVFNFEAKQRRISEVSFLGCLSDCQLVDTELLFDTLFMLVQFGYPQNQPRPDYYNELDPPGDFFRIRLVCSLLEATVDSIDRTNKRWDLFINFFQYYIYTKNTLSMDIEFQIHDTFEMLGISLVSDITSAALALRGALARYRGIEIPVSGDAASEGNEGSLQPSEVVVDDKQRRMEEAKRREEARIAKVARQDAKAVSDLEKEFQMVMAERMDRKADKKATVFDEPVPTLTHTDSDTGATVQSSTQEGRVGFMLLTKKGARLQTRSVQVPSNIKFVSSVEEERARLQKEQDKIRNIVLNYDYTESKQAPIRRIVQPMIPSVKYTRRKKLDANSIPDDL